MTRPAHKATAGEPLRDREIACCVKLGVEAIDWRCGNPGECDNGIDDLTKCPPDCPYTENTYPTGDEFVKAAKAIFGPGKKGSGYFIDADEEGATARVWRRVNDILQRGDGGAATEHEALIAAIEQMPADAKAMADKSEAGE